MNQAKKTKPAFSFNLGSKKSRVMTAALEELQEEQLENTEQPTGDAPVVTGDNTSTDQSQDATPLAEGADAAAAPADAAPVDASAEGTPVGDAGNPVDAGTQPVGTGENIEAAPADAAPVDGAAEVDATPVDAAPVSAGADTSGEGADMPADAPLDTFTDDAEGQAAQAAAAGVGGADSGAEGGEIPPAPEQTPPPLDGNPGDAGNAEVDALPDAPVIDSAAPADAGDTSALPDDSAEVDAVTPSTDEVVIGEEIEAQTTELAEIDTGVSETQEDMDTITAAVEELKDIVEIGRASVERGGLDAFGARHMSARMRSVCRALNEPMPSFSALESAENVSDQIMQTNNATSGAANLLSRAKATLKEGAQSLAEWAKKTYAVLTDASMRVEKRAMTLRARTAQSGQAVQVTDQTVIAGVTLGDSVPGDIARAVMDHAKAMAVINNVATYSKLIEAIDILQQISNDPSKKASLDAKFAAAIAGYSNKLIGQTAGVLIGGSNGSSVSKMFGEKQLTIMIPTDAGRIGEAKATLSEGKPANVPQSINGLDPQVAVKVCDAVVNAARQLREFNKSGASHRVNERLQSLVQSQAGAAASSDEGTSATMQLVDNMCIALEKAVAQMPSHAFNRAMIASLNAVLDYVSASAGAVAAPTEAPAAV